MIFSFYEFGHSGVLIVWYLCSVLNLIQIYLIVTEIDAQEVTEAELVTKRTSSKSSSPSLAMFITHNNVMRNTVPTAILKTV